MSGFEEFAVLPAAKRKAPAEPQAHPIWADQSCGHHHAIGRNRFTPAVLNWAVSVNGGLR